MEAESKAQVECFFRPCGGEGTGASSQGCKFGILHCSLIPVQGCKGEAKGGMGPVLPACRYGQDWWTLFKANMRRQKMLFLRNEAFIYIRM